MPPVPELADLPYAQHLTEHHGTLESHGEYDTVLFERLELDEPAAPSSRYLECAFSRVAMTAGQLQRSSFRDVWMRDVRLTGTAMPESSWLDVTVLASSLAGVQLYGSQLTRVVFSGCKVDSVNFRGAKLTKVAFERCVLRDVDFADAELTQCTFAGSRLTSTILTQTRMEGTDLRNADLGLVIDAQSLRGAIVSEGQLVLIAPALAETLGIIVRED